MKRTVLVVTLFGAAGCGGGTAAVQCDQDQTCDLSAGGRCTQSGAGNHWCSYPDELCPSGFRYSTFQVGEGLAGLCTSATAGSDAGIPPDAPPAMNCRQAVVFVDQVYQQRPEIWLTNLDGSHPVNLSNYPANNGNPSWAPVGDRVVFASDRGGQGHSDIYVVNLDGTGLINLTVGSTGNNLSPLWSPDGTRIAFLRANEPWVMNANGSGATRLWERHASIVQWSPMGSKVLVEDFGTSDVPINGSLYVIGVADGSLPRKLTSLTGFEFSPSWKASRIFFVRQSDIYSVKEDGTDLQNVTQDGLSNGNPRASNDSSVVAFDSTHNGTPGNPGYSEVWVRSGGTSRRLTQTTLALRDSFLVEDISGDGQYIAASHETTAVKNPDGEGSRISIVRLTDGSVVDINAPNSEFAREASFAPCRPAGARLANLGEGR